MYSVYGPKYSCSVRQPSPSRYPVCYRDDTLGPMKLARRIHKEKPQLAGVGWRCLPTRPALVRRYIERKFNSPLFRVGGTSWKCMRWYWHETIKHLFCRNNKSKCCKINLLYCKNHKSGFILWANYHFYHYNNYYNFFVIMYLIATLLISIYIYIYALIHLYAYIWNAYKWINVIAISITVWHLTLKWNAKAWSHLAILLV